MKKWIRTIRGKKPTKQRNQPEWPPVDLGKEIESIRNSESDTDIGLGRKIHGFPFHEFELCVDRDITGMYRLVVYQGTERKYSFSIRCKHRDYTALRSGFEEIVKFLEGNRRIADLPKQENLKGFYFGST